MTGKVAPCLETTRDASHDVDLVHAHGCRPETPIVVCGLQAMLTMARDDP